MTLEDVRAAARAWGFEAVLQADVRETPPVEKGAHPQAQALLTDPCAVLPGAKSVLLLAMPYRPFKSNPGEAEIDAYYIASNRAHENARHLAEWLNSEGVRAEMTAVLRVKPLAARAGLGKYGRNTLIAVGAYGTRVSLQTIVTDMPCEQVQNAEAPNELDESCRHCRACMQACPGGALRGDGTLDITRCVRAQSEGEPLPEDMRPMVGASLLGCDICQRVCPRNAAAEAIDIPMDVREALSLSRLLRGEYRAFIPLIGKNNARKMRLVNRAALAAANRGREDLMPLLKELSSWSDPVGSHARWAAKCLDNAASAAEQSNDAIAQGDVTSQKDVT